MISKIIFYLKQGTFFRAVGIRIISIREKKTTIFELLQKAKSNG